MNYFSKISSFKEVYIKQRNINNNPWWNGIHLVAIAALIIRLIIAYTTDHLFQPDEIFQYVEQAHRKVFGYGYLPWEYRFGARSCILPGFISSILYICKILNVDKVHIYVPVVKTVFSIFSISLVYTSYIIARNLVSEKSGRLAALLICVWYELFYFANKAIPEIISTYLIIGAIACLVVNEKNRKPILFGILSSFAVVLRFQYSFVVLFLFICSFLIWDKKRIIRMILGTVCIFFFAGFLDYLTLGAFFISFYNNYLYNIVYKVSEIFGKENILYYLKSIFITSIGIFPAFLFLSLKRIKKIWLPLSCTIMVLLVHSLIPHKEYRFILLSIPLMLLLVAVGLSELFEKKLPNDKRKLFYALSIIFLTIISIFGLLRKLPFQERIYRTPIYRTHSTFPAYKFLSKEKDLNGLLNLHSKWYRTGGYYYLHRDIPIYYLYHFRKKKFRKKMLNFVSHIICTEYNMPIKGFKKIAQFKKLIILKQINPPLKYQTWGKNLKVVRQGGVDGVFTPTINKRY